MHRDTSLFVLSVLLSIFKVDVIAVVLNPIFKRNEERPENSRTKGIWSPTTAIVVKCSTCWTIRPTGSHRRVHHKWWRFEVDIHYMWKLYIWTVEWYDFRITPLSILWGRSYPFLDFRCEFEKLWSVGHSIFFLPRVWWHFEINHKDLAQCCKKKKVFNSRRLTSDQEVLRYSNLCTNNDE